MIREKRFLALIVLGAIFSLVFFTHGRGAELKDGMVIDKNNYKLAEDVLVEKMTEQMLNYDLAIVYKDPVEKLMVPELEEQTKKYAGQTKLDMSTLAISNYYAGDPFTREEIEKETDPAVKGTKIMWNCYYSYSRCMADSFSWPSFYWVWIDGRKGVQRSMYSGFYRYYMKHRCIMEPVMVEPNDMNLFFKGMIGALRPYDLAGFGTLDYRFDDGRLDQRWAYIPVMRRIRRLSSGSWMDSVMGTDWTGDDLQVFDPYPTWYKGYKFLGKKTVLAPAETDPNSYDLEVFDKDFREGSRMYDFDNAPFWNTKGQWYQPTEVYVTECIAPDEHPYSRRIHYVDTITFTPYYGELFDNRGEYWKWQEMGYIRKKELTKNSLVYEPHYLHQRDILTMHATVCPIGALQEKVRINDPEFKEEWFTQSTLINLGK